MLLSNIRQKRHYYGILQHCPLRGDHEITYMYAENINVGTRKFSIWLKLCGEWQTIVGCNPRRLQKHAEAFCVYFWRDIIKEFELQKSRCRWHDAKFWLVDKIMLSQPHDLTREFPRTHSAGVKLDVTLEENLLEHDSECKLKVAACLNLINFIN